MRKVISIFFLVVFLLYHVGYLAFYHFQAYQIEQQWLAQVELSPNLKHISIPINLPYWNDQSDYRPTHGQLEIDGKTYQKVMQKYAGNQLHLLIEEDHQTAALDMSFNDWIKSMTMEGHGSKKDLGKTIAKDYLAINNSYALSKDFQILGQPIARFSFSYQDQFLETDTPPPQV